MVNISAWQAKATYMALSFWEIIICIYEKQTEENRMPKKGLTTYALPLVK